MLCCVTPLLVYHAGGEAGSGPFLAVDRPQWPPKHVGGDGG